MTNVRLTSKIAYREITENNTRTRQAEKIMNFIDTIITGNASTDVSLREIQKVSNLDINAISGRVNELKKDGKLVECEKRKCKVTGRLITPVRPSVSPVLIGDHYRMFG